MTRRMVRGLGTIRDLAPIAVVVALTGGAAAAQTAQQPAQPQADPVAQEKMSLEQQLAEQQARNEALRQRIAKLEQVLATDVCNNPEAAAVLQETAAPAAPGPSR